MSEYITEIIVTKEERDKHTKSRVSMMKVSFDTYAQLSEWLWKKLTNEERSNLTCCRGCGSLDTSCRCWDDS